MIEGALFIAIAQVLSMLKLWEMPWGGSVTLAMVPILLFAVRWGVGPGLAAGFVFGILQFTFDGVKYDNASFTSAGVTKPNGWVQNNTNEKQYENSLYPECYILEGMHQGATFMISKKNGQTSFPSLQLYKGLTWGATVADVKAAYGEAVKEGHSEQYGTTMTNLFYTDAEGSLIIFMVSDDWGLFGINCQGK